MKFIVDAQLPKLLSDLLNKEGHDSVHTSELVNKNKTTDSNIIEITIEENRIIITKDQDFLDSYLLNRAPPKLLLVRTGNISNNKLLKIFEQNLLKIVQLFNSSGLIEIYVDELIVHSTN
jgi:predicted nuclease of predicted toxin-antitoxin system